MYCLNFSSMEVIVKSADSQYDSSIINYYIIMGLDRAKSMESINDTKAVHLRIYNTLLNTMCDTCLPINWREVCYTYLERMMPLFSTIYNDHDFKKYRNELNILYMYFCKTEHQLIKYCYSFEIKNRQI